MGETSRHFLLQICPTGIGRTFQITTLFRSITVMDNLRLSLEALPATRLSFLKSGSFQKRM